MPDETKQCPYCKESVNIEAVVCRYCGSDLAEPPMTKPKPWSFIVVAAITAIVMVLGVAITPRYLYPALETALIFGAIGLWASSGYMGAYWLIKKGFLWELAGCAILAGGTALLFPIAGGPLLLVAAYLLRDRPKRRTNPSPKS